MANAKTAPGVLATMRRGVAVYRQAPLFFFSLALLSELPQIAEEMISGEGWTRIIVAYVAGVLLFFWSGYRRSPRPSGSRQASRCACVRSSRSTPGATSTR